MNSSRLTYGLLDPFLFHVLLSVVGFNALDRDIDFYNHFAFELISPVLVILFSGSFVSKLINNLVLSARTITNKSIFRFFCFCLFIAIAILIYNYLSAGEFSNYDRMLAAKKFKFLWLLSFFFPPLFITYCICTFRNKLNFYTVSPFILVFVQQLFSLSASAIAFPLLLYIRSLLFLIAPYPIGMSKSFTSVMKYSFSKLKISKSNLKGNFLVLSMIVFIALGILYMYATLGRSTADLFSRITSDSIGIYSTASFDLVDQYVSDNNFLAYLFHPLSSFVGIRGYDVPLGAGIRDSLLLNGAVAGVGSLIAAFTYSNEFLYLTSCVIATIIVIFLRLIFHRVIFGFFKFSDLMRKFPHLLLFQHVLIDYSLVAIVYGEYSNFSFYIVCNILSITFLRALARHDSGLTISP